MKDGDKKNFTDIANQIGELVQEKNIAYGDSFAKSQEIVKILYPNGVQPEQYMDMLAIVRVIDKLFRIATKKDAFGESPWRDICGYAILGVANDEVEGEEAVTYRELLRNPDRYMTDKEQKAIKELVKESVLFNACSEEEQERITESVAESIRVAQSTKTNAELWEEQNEMPSKGKIYYTREAWARKQEEVAPVIEQQEAIRESIVQGVRDKRDEGHGNPYANIDDDDEGHKENNDNANAKTLEGYWNKIVTKLNNLPEFKRRE